VLDAAVHGHLRGVSGTRHALEERAATLLPGLFLGRVDGKSPVEYLDQAGQALVREAARKLLVRASAPSSRATTHGTNTRRKGTPRPGTRAAADGRGGVIVRPRQHAAASGRAIAPAGASTGSGEAKPSTCPSR